MRHVAVLCLSLLAACAGPGAIERDVAGEPEVAACLEGYRLMDRAVEAADVRDAEAHRIPGFPYLRVNRFLASFGERDLDGEAFAAWVDRLVRLGREGRTVELLNLPPTDRRTLDREVRATLGPAWDADTVVVRCPELLRRHDLARPERRTALLAAAEVPDDYALGMRALGLYPLAAIPVALGYERWQAKHLPVFEVPTDALAWQGKPVLYAPEGGERLTDADVAAILERARANPLAVPEVEGEDLARLARHFAPAFLIDIAADADRIGRPYWTGDGRPVVDPEQPVAFVRLEHGWFEGEPTAQLVYLIWFDARPKTGPLDILGGRLDGLIWRVTLGDDGTPRVFDTIHPCGCYHLFFPADGVRRLPLPQDASSDIRETVIVPRPAPTPGSDERLTVRLAATSHYVTGLATTPADDGKWPRTSYRLVVADGVPDLPLRSMPWPGGGRRSLYGPDDGLVAGTERLERFLFWPMGIESAGAMRQWGNHATAFVGERHFDDPHLLERAFAP